MSALGFHFHNSGVVGWNFFSKLLLGFMGLMGKFFAIGKCVEAQFKKRGCHFVRWHPDGLVVVGILLGDDGV